MCQTNQSIDQDRREVKRPKLQHEPLDKVNFMCSGVKYLFMFQEVDL